MLGFWHFQSVPWISDQSSSLPAGQNPAKWDLIELVRRLYCGPLSGLKIRVFQIDLNRSDPLNRCGLSASFIRTVTGAENEKKFRRDPLEEPRLTCQDSLATYRIFHPCCSARHRQWSRRDPAILSSKIVRLLVFRSSRSASSFSCVSQSLWPLVLFRRPTTLFQFLALFLLRYLSFKREFIPVLHLHSIEEYFLRFYLLSLNFFAAGPAFEAKKLSVCSGSTGPTHWGIRWDHSLIAVSHVSDNCWACRISHENHRCPQR